MPPRPTRGGASTARERPKSRRETRPSSSTRTLRGWTSEWITPCACSFAYWAAQPVDLAVLHQADAADDLPVAEVRAALQQRPRLAVLLRAGGDEHPVLHEDTDVGHELVEPLPGVLAQLAAVLDDCLHDRARGT